jgi:hypothetical protein
MRGSVCGYVVRGGGNAVAGTTVVGIPVASTPAGTTAPAGPAPDPDSGAPTDDVAGGPWPDLPAPEVSTLTDGAGHFTFERLREGRWLLQARGSRGERTGETRVHVFDNSMSAVTITVVGLAAGVRRPPDARRTTRTGRTMTGSPRGGGSGTVRGRVVRGADGSVVADATVTAVRGPGPAPDLAPMTDQDGGFVFDGLAAGSWVLRAHGPGGETGEAAVRVPDGGEVAATIPVVDGAAWGVPEIG